MGLVLPFHSSRADPIAWVGPHCLCPLCPGPPWYPATAKSRRQPLLQGSEPDLMLIKSSLSPCHLHHLLSGAAGQ